MRPDRLAVPVQLQRCWRKRVDIWWPRLRAREPAAMIVCHRRHLVLRCVERGYTLAEVMPCVVAQDGDTWTVDTGHPAYPSAAKHGLVPQTIPRSGPGTELKKLLGRIGIVASPNCKCNSRARLMDRMGIEWCEANIDRIVGYLREAAADRGLPFIDAAGRLLVKRAIRNARRAAS